MTSYSYSVFTFSEPCENHEIVDNNKMTKISPREKVDESSEEVKIKFVDEIFRTESRQTSLTNGDTPDEQGE